MVTQSASARSNTPLPILTFILAVVCKANTVSDDRRSVRCPETKEVCGIFHITWSVGLSRLLHSLQMPQCSHSNRRTICPAPAMQPENS